MRILCLTSRLPYPPDRGDRLRAYHFIRHMAREHELALVSFVADPAEQDHVAALRAHCQDVRVIHLSSRRSALAAAANAWRRDPLQSLYYRSAQMQQLVDRVLASQPYQAAYVHLFRMAPYVAARPDLYRIVDLTDVISKEVRRSLPYRGLRSRLIYRLEQPRIERYERLVTRTFEETWLISEADRVTLAGACPGANIRVVPNGVDQDAFHPTGQAANPERLIFVGHLRVFHNVDAVRHLVQDILPRVQAEFPACRLAVVGADPGPEVLALAANPAVEVTGFVPDLNAHLNRAAVFVAPLRFAAGIQNKVLEAMAAGRPVVTTGIVQQGLGAVAGRDLLVADDAPSTATQVCALLRDPDLRQRIGQAGLQFVRRTYTWEHVVQRLRAIEQEIAL